MEITSTWQNCSREQFIPPDEIEKSDRFIGAVTANIVGMYGTVEHAVRSTLDKQSVRKCTPTYD